MKSREEKARVELPGDANLLSLPNELLEIIDFYLASPKDKAAVAITCAGLHAFFQPKLNKIDAKKLGQHIVFGEKEEARKMLEKNSRLLLIEVEVTDEAGRRIRGKAYRFALGAYDFDMAKMIEFFFDKLENGEEEKKKQFNEQFPDSYDPNAHEQIDFEGIINAIATDPMIDGKPNEVTKAVLDRLKERIRPKADEVIMTGRHFDMQIYLDAVAAYDNHKQKLMSQKQHDLYCLQVVGLTQSVFTTFDAQMFCTAVKTEVNSGVVDRTSPMLFVKDCHPFNVRFFSKELGESVYIHSFNNGYGKYAYGYTYNFHEAPRLELTDHNFAKLYKKREAEWVKLAQRLRHPILGELAKLSCVIS